MKDFSFSSRDSFFSLALCCIAAGLCPASVFLWPPCGGQHLWDGPNEANWQLTTDCKNANTQSCQHQRTSWPMTNCSPGQALCSPLRDSWDLSRQVHHVFHSTYLLCHFLSSLITQTTLLNLVLSHNKAIFQSIGPVFLQLPDWRCTSRSKTQFLSYPF